MRKLLLSIVLVLSFFSVFAQNPVKWQAAVEAAGDNNYNIVFTATVERGWHLYDMGPYEGGPNPTEFSFEIDGEAELIGGVTYQEEPEKVFDKIFEMNIGYFENNAVFIQPVKVHSKAIIKAIVEWMACNNTTCIPPTDQEFSFELNPADTAAPSEPASIPAIDEEHSQDTPADIPFIENSDDSAEPSAQQPAAQSDSGLWLLILQAIAWGLAALVTPCVFPMIPMTVSYFIKGSENKAVGRMRASMYGLFIVLLYTVPIAVLIILTRIIGGDSVTLDIFNWLATHWIPNLLFFIIFMIFAASFFGAFEIVLPSKLVNGSDKKSEKKGLGGVFFMALTLVLVSFSCTGPIVGTVLIKSTSGEFWTPILTMLAFSITFALPFTLFALFPGLLKNLPKSGGWLNTVKVVLGFIELALGLKFLSVADQTYQWGILDREVYLAIWIVVFTLLGFYLLGKLRFKNDSPLEYISVTRLVLAIATFTFVVYMIPGMWGAPLKAISGYLPPMQTQDFVLGQESAKEIRYVTGDNGFPEHVKYENSGLELPLGLQGFFDLDEAETYAESVGKPLFIDFTGLGCMNCREMEARVLSDPEILRMLNDDYVVVSLFMDDKKVEVDPSDWIVTDAGKTLKTLGKINSYRALKEFGINSQPYYFIIGHGRILTEPRAYDLDIEAFREFLKKGIQLY